MKSEWIVEIDEFWITTSIILFVITQNCKANWQLKTSSANDGDNDNRGPSLAVLFYFGSVCLKYRRLAYFNHIHTIKDETVLTLWVSRLVRTGRQFCADRVLVSCKRAYRQYFTCRSCPSRLSFHNIFPYVWILESFL